MTMLWWGSARWGNRPAANNGELLTIRGRRPVTLVVGNDVAAIITEDAYTAVGRSEIDTNRGSHFGVVCENLDLKKDRNVPSTGSSVMSLVRNLLELQKGK